MMDNLYIKQALQWAIDNCESELGLVLETTQNTLFIRTSNGTNVMRWKEWNELPANPNTFWGMCMACMLDIIPGFHYGDWLISSYGFVNCLIQHTNEDDTHPNIICQWSQAFAKIPQNRYEVDWVPAQDHACYNTFSFYAPDEKVAQAFLEQFNGDVMSIRNFRVSNINQPSRILDYRDWTKHHDINDRKQGVVGCRFYLLTYYQSQIGFTLCEDNNPLDAFLSFLEDVIFMCVLMYDCNRLDAMALLSALWETGSYEDFRACAYDALSWNGTIYKSPIFNINNTHNRNSFQFTHMFITPSGKYIYWTR